MRRARAGGLPTSGGKVVNRRPRHLREHRRSGDRDRRDPGRRREIDMIELPNVDLPRHASPARRRSRLEVLNKQGHARLVPRQNLGGPFFFLSAVQQRKARQAMLYLIHNTE